MPRILAADDNKMIRVFYEDVIATLGMDFQICKDGREALEAFRKQPADLVILDYEMPEMDGFECCKAIRNTPEGVMVPIIIVSSHDDEEHISKCLDAGANDYLTKPVKETHLIAKLKNHLRISALNKGECDLIKSHAVIGGRYRIERMLGCGAHSTVFLVSDTQDNEKQLALKLLNETASAGDVAKEFFKVADKVKGISSDYVVKILDIGQYGGRAFVVMEYLDGGDLSGLLKKKGRLDEAETLRMALDIALGLEAFHSANLIHLDLKPENILLDSATGHFKLADFGIITKRTTSTMPLNSEIWSTLAYVPPEYFREDAEVSQASDIYSLGVTIYQCFTGDNPFMSERAAVTMFRHINIQPPLLKDCGLLISPELSDLVTLLLSKSMTERPDAKQTAEMLDAIIKNPMSQATRIRLMAEESAQKAGQIKESMSIDKVKSEINASRKVKAKVEREERRKSFAVMFILTVTITSVCIGLGYYLSRHVLAPSPEAGARVTLSCSKCGKICTRRTTDIKKEHCPECGASLGYAMNCNFCKKIFSYCMEDLSGITDKLVLISKMDESRKCHHCGSRNIEPVKLATESEAVIPKSAAKSPGK